MGLERGAGWRGPLAVEAVTNHLSMRLAVLDVVPRHELRSFFEIQNPNRLKELRSDRMSPPAPFASRKANKHKKSICCIYTLGLPFRAPGL
jgi:hypothetical protein